MSEMAAKMSDVGMKIGLPGGVGGPTDAGFAMSSYGALQRLLEYQMTIEDKGFNALTGERLTDEAKETRKEERELLKSILAEMKKNNEKEPKQKPRQQPVPAQRRQAPQQPRN
jgi:hypothetical protein